MLVVLRHESVELVLDVLLDLLGLLGLLGLLDHLVDVGQVGLNLVELRDADLDLVDEAQAHVGGPDINRVVSVRTRVFVGTARSLEAGAHVHEPQGLVGREDLLVVLRVPIGALSSESAVHAKAAHLLRHLDCRL